MTAINQLLISLSTATRKAIWYGSIALFFITMAVASGIYEKKKTGLCRLAFKNAVLTVISFCLMLSVAYGIEIISKRFIFLSGVIYCIPDVFFSAYVLHKSIQRDLLDCADQVMQAYLIGRVFNITGCSFVGCCQGVPVEWGIYSAVSNTTVVPVQAIESLCILIAWFLLNRYYRQNDYETGGKVAIIGLVVFGMINFTTDIFTVTFQKVVFMTSIEGIAAFLTMCIGLIMLYVLAQQRTASARSN